MAKLDKEDVSALVAALLEGVREDVTRVAENTARDIAHRILDADNSDLRHRVRAVIRQQVAEEVGKHLQVQVLWT